MSSAPPVDPLSPAPIVRPDASPPVDPILLEAMSAAVAVVDGFGTILAVNSAWTRDAADAITHDGRYTVGANLRQLNAHRAAKGESVAMGIETGLRSTLERKTPRFETELDAPGASPPRWFTVRIVPMAGDRVLVGIEDVTARRIAEQRAELAGALLRSAIDLLPLAVYWKDVESRYIDGNRKFREDAGIDDVRGKFDHEMPWKNAARELVTDDREILVNGLPRTERTISYDIANGQQSFLVWSKAPLTGPDGKPAGVVGNYQDVTERRRYEQSVARLAKEMSRLSLVARKTQNAVFIADENERIVWINPGFSQITGRPAPEVMGKTPYEIFTGGKADTAALVRLGKALQEGKAYRDEILYRHPEGRDIWIEAELQPLTGPSGQLAGYIGVNNDITARVAMRAEFGEMRERLALMQKITGHANWTWERDGKFVAGDARLAEIYGVAPESFPMAGGNWIDRAVPEDRSKLAAALLAGMSGDGPAIPRFRIMRDDGGVRTLEASATIERDPAGAPRRLIGVLADVTDRPAG